MKIQKKLWEILVPRYSNQGLEFSIEHHQEWDKNVRKIAKGLTIFRSVTGHWINPEGKLYVERMIPVRILCSEKQIQYITDYALDHYDQEAVLAYVISEQIIFKQRGIENEI